MSEPMRDNDHPVTYSASGLPPDVSFGPSAEHAQAGLRTYTASGLPDGVRFNSNSAVGRGHNTFGTATKTLSADESSSAPDGDVKPDLLIDLPKQDPDHPQEPPGSAGQ